MGWYNKNTKNIVYWTPLEKNKRNELHLDGSCVNLHEDHWSRDSKSGGSLEGRKREKDYLIKIPQMRKYTEWER